MISEGAVAQYWRSNPKAGFDDLCLETAQNAVSVLLNSSRPKDKIGIVSGKLSDSFYSVFFATIREKFPPENVCALVEDFDSARRTVLGSYMESIESLYEIPEWLRQDAPHFMVFGTHSFRSVLSLDPYSAVSYHRRPDLARTWVSHFLRLKAKSEQSRIAS